MYLRKTEERKIHSQISEVRGYEFRRPLLASDGVTFVLKVYLLSHTLPTS